MKNIFQTRTFWSGLATLISTLLTIFKVSPEITQATTAVFGFLTILFVRDAIEKNGVGNLPSSETDSDFGDGGLPDSRQP